MNKTILFQLSAILFLTGCGGFTASEKAIIGKESDGIMRLYTIDNPEDSLFLRGEAKELTRRHIRSPYYQVLTARMLETVNDPGNAGVGIAAPQVGLPYRLVAVQRTDKSGEPFELYINPEIVSYSDETRTGREGCLSVPECAGQVSRSGKITVRHADPETLKPIEEDVAGFTAVIFQHEVDHLDGILYIDRTDSVYRRVRPKN